MKHNSHSPTAIALISGGLDSALAACLVKRWGIHVIGLHLTSPFGCTTEAQKVAEDLKIPLQIRAKGEAFIDLIEKPKYGYGSQMNPCIDCRIYMFEWAEKVRQEFGADFIVTGEVVGQRPLSQNKAAMTLIDRKSPLEDRILRPLSGGNLPPTLPEKQGWIQRDQLRKFSGRGRTEQLALAQELGVAAFTSPGGGCLLTEKAFSDRLRDFYRYPHYSTSDQKTAQAELLRLGRHFRPHSEFKVIVARTESENDTLHSLWKPTGALLIKPLNYLGPSALVLGNLSDEFINSVAQLVARYGKRPESEVFQLSLRRSDAQNAELFSSINLSVSSPLTDEVLKPWRIGIT